MGKFPAAFGLCCIALAGCGRLGFDEPDCSTYRAAMAPYAAGTGTVADPFQICSPAQLSELAVSSGDRTSRFVLLSDLDFTGIPFNGIGTTTDPFSGFLDGNGHTISNVTVTSTAGEPTGFVNYAVYARIENLTLVNVTVDGADRVGAVIGSCEMSHVSNTSLTAIDVRGTSKVGGLVGLSYDCLFVGAHLSGTIVGTVDSVGGLVGMSEQSTLFNVDATVNVNSPLASAVGGIVGSDDYSPLVVQNVRVTGDVAGYDDVGGLVGSNAEGVYIYRSRFEGTVSGNRGVGGFAGGNYDSPFHVYSTSVAADVVGNTGVGGFSGNYYYRTRTFDSYFTGTLTGTGANQAGFGGFFGDVQYYGWVERSYVDATINSTASTVGGFMGNVGYWSADPTSYDVTRSFAAVNLTGSSPTSTISRWVGENTDVNPVVGVGSYYWSGGACVNLGGGGCATAGGMPVDDLAQLHGSGGAAFATWDFANVWQTQPGGFPTLRLEQNHAPVATFDCPDVAIVGLQYVCAVTVSDADVNEAQIVVLDPTHSCGFLNPNLLDVEGRPTSAHLGACEVAFSVTDGAYSTAVEKMPVDVHLGVVVMPANSLGTEFMIAFHPIGTPPVTQVFTLTNHEEVTVTDLAIGGLPQGDFRFVGGAYPGTGGTCTTTLAPAASCTVAISYGATAIGPSVAPLDIRFTAARGPISYVFTVTGYGT